MKTTITRVAVLGAAACAPRSPQQRGGVLVGASAGTHLHDWLRRGRATAAVVRPDGTVLHAACDPFELCAAMPRFGTAAHAPLPSTKVNDPTR